MNSSNSKLITVIAMILATLMVFGFAAIMVRAGSDSHEGQRNGMGIHGSLRIEYDPDLNSYIQTDVDTPPSSGRVKLSPTNQSTTATTLQSIITGKVVDCQGNALRQVEITACVNPLQTGAPPSINSFAGSIVTRSDDTGSFELTVEPKSRYYLLAKKAGFVPSLCNAYPNQDRLLILDKASSPIHGKVIDEVTGRGIANVEISAINRKSGVSSTFTSTTDENGKFTLTETPNVFNEVSFYKKGYYSLRLFNMNFDTAGTRCWKLSEAKCLVKPVIVYSDDTENPINSINVDKTPSIADSSGIHYLTTWPDNNSPENTVLIESEGHCSAKLDTRKLSIESNIYRLPRATGCYGKLVNPIPNSFNDVTIRIIYKKHKLGIGLHLYNQPIEIASDGYFKIESVPLGIPFKLSFKKEEHPIEYSKELMVEGNWNSYIGEFVIKTGYGKLTGVIKGEDGPLPGAWIGIHRLNDNYLRTITDHMGHFEIQVDSLDEILISREGYLTYRSTDLLHVPDNKEYHLNVKLERADRVTGMALDRHGNAVPGAILHISGPLKAKTGQKITTGSGSFTLDGFIKGETYRIKAYRDLIPSVCESPGTLCTGGDTDIAVPLIEVGSLFGEIRSEGCCLAGEEVDIFIYDKTTYEMNNLDDFTIGFTRTDGHYSLILEEGRYVVVFDGKNFSKKELFVNISQDEPQNINVDLVRKLN